MKFLQYFLYKNLNYINIIRFTLLPSGQEFHTGQVSLLYHKKCYDASKRTLIFRSRVGALWVKREKK